MKRNDRLIISYLRQDGRIQLTKMSKQTKIPVSTLFERLKSYESSFVKKHTAIIDFEKMGYSTRAKVLLKVKKGNRSDCIDFLQKSSHTNELFVINNGFDLMAELIFRDMKEMEGYLKLIEDKFEVKKQQVFYVIDEIKREDFLSKPHLLKLGSLGI